LGFTFRVLRSPEEWTKLRAPWEVRIERQSGNILGLDVTSTLTWAETLWENHLGRKSLEVLVAESDDEVEALLPFYRSPKTVHSVPCRSIAPITELYSGRCGFLLNEPRVELLECMLKGLREQVPGWDVFVFTLVEESPSRMLLSELEQRGDLWVEKISAQRSPYIVMDKAWEEYFAGLPRKFRWNLRNFEKKMRSAGSVVHRVFESGSNLEEFRSATQEIERASWKEQAGTSLTTNSLQENFHAKLMHAAADRGWFTGHVLEFRGEPVSYVWGLRYGNIFYDFKESYKSVYRDLGPGHVLKLSLMERLFAQGVAFYDYMGLCEEYKLRWTDKTYERSTFLLYNNTLAARAARLAGNVKKHLLGSKTNPESTSDLPTG
jgi:hypothetical protein